MRKRCGIAARASILACSLAAALGLWGGRAEAKELGGLRVAVVGFERNEDFVQFLTPHVSEVIAFKRDQFDPEAAADFDVVLLDWPQPHRISGGSTTGGTDSLKEDRCPLGEREDWGRPTVLIGSAGMRVSCKWAVRGSRGCTCLYPEAYDLREHPIFEHPFAIDRGLMRSISTPASFRSELEVDEISVLPLGKSEDRRPGFCTYLTGFEDYPEIEVFCGGVNDKTPKAAAVWRQGNLLHFGFDLTPAEMDDVGDQLLLNSIAYISDFSQDRPIAISPAPFVGPSSRPRDTIAKWLAKPDRAEWVEDMVTPETWQTISSQGSSDAMVAWAEENTAYLFATDLGHYRWYVDPLAKQRKLPTEVLRGPARKDR